MPVQVAGLIERLFIYVLPIAVLLFPLLRSTPNQCRASENNSTGSWLSQASISGSCLTAPESLNNFSMPGNKPFNYWFSGEQAILKLNPAIDLQGLSMTRAMVSPSFAMAAFLASKDASVSVI